MITCKFCGKSIFWLKDHNGILGESGRNVPFEDDVVTITKTGQKFADGGDKLHISTDADVKAQTKGFLYHWGRCKR